MAERWISSELVGREIYKFDKISEMTAEEICNKILSEIPDGASGKMFGANAIKMPNGKAGAFFKNDRLIVKIHGNDLSEAEKLDDVKPFSPKEE